MDRLSIKRDTFHGEWNYCAVSQMRCRMSGPFQTAKTPMAPRQRVELIALRFSGTPHYSLTQIRAHLLATPDNWSMSDGRFRITDNLVWRES